MSNDRGMSSPLTTLSINNKRRRRMKSILAMTAVVLANEVGQSQSFNTIRYSSSTGTRRIASLSPTSLSFQHNSEVPTQTNVFSNDYRFAVSNNANAIGYIRPVRGLSIAMTEQLPAWLSLDRSHLKLLNIDSLRRFMFDSFYTEKESRMLVDAIIDAADGDDNKIAGAAEFCLLLAELMEMGVDALIAAAFHYCSCYTAREEAALRYTNSGSSFAWTIRLSQHPNLRKYGDQIVDIENDTAQLKNIELVAASVFAQYEGRSGRNTPDKAAAENLRHLMLTETKDWRALAIRSAACLFRLRGIIAANEQKLTNESNQVAREALSIYAPLASKMGMHRLKNELEGTAFRILYPRQHAVVTAFQNCASYSDGEQGGNSIAQAMQEVLETVKNDITILLKNDREFRRQVANFSVTARVKEPYSLWKKMLRLGHRHVLQVPDALAFRIVLNAKKLSPSETDDETKSRESALCYYAQSLCQAQYKPMISNPRLKDYIAHPKHNGYQSLHYTANAYWGNQEWTMEIQVRSGAMHSVAEFGLASHSDYKSQPKNSALSANNIDAFDTNVSNVDNSSDAYLRNLQKWKWQHHGGKKEIHLDKSEPVVWHSGAREKWIRQRSEHLKPYLEALTDAQSDLARDNVFVFLSPQYDDGNSVFVPEGKVLALPAGACVLDAIREMERVLGLPLPKNQGFNLNGIETSITKQLQNGDILGIQCPTLPNTIMA
jgi:ppGpp synthetase/RelA/SpoT-type nucleotidyltranferase